MIAEAAVAFAGGALTLFSPCSALLLPSFFAYAFSGPGRILARTAIFTAGLITFLVPLGVGVGALGSLLLLRRGELTLAAGALLVAIGLYQLAVGGFELPGADRLAQAGSRLTADSALSTYLLGAVYGFGGFCAGPILGGVLTIAAASGGAAAGAALLAVYALGMALPLLVLALGWARLGEPARHRLVGTEVRIGRLRRPLPTVASSLIFVVLGASFALTQGSNALAPLYAWADTETRLLEIEALVAEAAAAVPDLAWIAALAAGAALVAWRSRDRSRTTLVPGLHGQGASAPADTRKPDSRHP